MSFDYDVHFQLTPLQAAAWRGKREEVQRLIEAGTEVDEPHRTGKTPLHRIAMPYPHADVGANLQVEIAQMLLESGANVNAKDNRHVTPLHLAALWGKDKLAELFLLYGADVEATTNTAHTPLHWAVTNGKTNVVELLLARGANANVATEFGGELSSPPLVPKGKYTPLALVLAGLQLTEERKLPEDQKLEAVMHFQILADLLRRYGGESNSTLLATK